MRLFDQCDFVIEFFNFLILGSDNLLEMSFFDLRLLGILFFLSSLSDKSHRSHLYLRAHTVKFFFMLFSHHGYPKFQLTDFDSKIINDFLIEFSFKNFVFKLFVEFVSILLDHFLQIDNLLGFEFKLILVVLLKRGDISMSQLAKFHFQCLTLLFCSLGNFSYLFPQLYVDLFYSLDLLPLFPSQYFYLL